MKRMLALVAAAVMIGGALFVRARLDDNSSSSSSDTHDNASSVGTLVCATELAAPCDALQKSHPGLIVRVEDAATTEAALTKADSAAAIGFDAWLVPRPFPDMVSEQRQRSSLQPILGDVSDPIARSPLVLVVWNDRKDALAGSCPGADVTWKCVGELAGTPWAQHGGQEAWGSVKPGHPSPETTAAGLLVLAQATGSWFGTPDYAANDFGNPAFRAWFEQLERSIPLFPTSPRTPLDEMLSKGPSTFDLTGGLEAASGPAVARSRDKDRLTILYPSPAATADLVVAPVAGAAAGGRVSTLLQSNDAAQVFAEAGWRVDGQPLADGIPADQPLPDGDGLPRAGVLQALRSLWIEIIR